MKAGAFVALGVLAVGACGGKSAHDTAGNSGTDLFGGYGLEILPAPKGDAHDPDAGAGAPQRGGKVTYALQSEDDNGYCLPEAQLDASGEQVAGSIYDTLTRPTVDGTFAPYLAEKVDHSPDYLTWTITLRPDVKFSDGSALDATVLKNNLDAYRGQYPGRSALLFQFVFDNVKDVRVTGPLVVEVDMTKPWKDFDSYLYGSRRMGIVGQAQLDDKDNCATNLIGTGPFKLDSWLIGQKYVLKANPNYWRKDASGQQLPYLDELDYVPFKDSQASINAFTAGTTDGLMTSSSDAVVKLRRLANSGKARLVTSVRDTELAYLMLNARTPPFDDASMRLAAAEAIDMGRINQMLGHDVTPLAAQPFPPGSDVYSPEINRIPLNMADAQQRVKAYADAHDAKPKVVVTATPDTLTTQTAQLIRGDLERAGFSASVATTDTAQLIQAAIKGEFQLQTWRNHNGSDPGAQYVWWHSGYPTNFNGFSDPIIDCLLDTGRSGDAAAACLQDPKLNEDYNTDLPDGFPHLDQIKPDDTVAIYRAISVEFRKKVWNIWGAYSPWAAVTKPTVHGVFGAPNPDGSKPSQSLVNGTPVETFWVES